MKDDPRDFNWAPNQIEELKDRVKRLEGQTEFESSEDNDRIKALFAAVHELQSVVASMRTQQDLMISKGHGEPFEVWCRRKINSLAHGFEVHARLIEKSEERLDDLDDRVSGMTPYIELETRVSTLEGYPRRITPGLPRMSEPDDGPSFRDDPYDSMKVDATLPKGTAVAGIDNYMVSPVVETSDQIAERRRVLVEAMKDGRITFGGQPVRPGRKYERDLNDEPDLDAVNRLIEAGPFKAGDVIPSWITTARAMNEIRIALERSDTEFVLNQAEARVRHYLTTNAPWTIEGVVRAVHARPEPDFQPEEAKVVGTVCPAKHYGPVACWAVDRLHWHDKYGVVHVD